MTRRVEDSICDPAFEYFARTIQVSPLAQELCNILVFFCQRKLVQSALNIFVVGENYVDYEKKWVFI